MSSNILSLRICLIGLLFLTTRSSLAQPTRSDPRDAQGWYGFTLTADLPSKWDVFGGYQARFINNLSEYNGSYLTIGGSRKMGKYLELQGDYRMALLRTAIYHRFTLGAEVTKKIKKFKFSIRGRIQNQLQDFDDTARLSESSGYWRVRLQGEYRISKKWEVYLSTEPIMKFGGNYFIDNIRNTAGLSYRHSAKLAFSAFYIYRPDYGKSYNRVYNVFGFAADYRLLKVKKKKDKKSGASNAPAVFYRSVPDVINSPTIRFPYS